MALKNIANGDATLNVSIPLGAGSANITSTPSVKVKAMSKGVYRGGLNFVIPSGAGISGTCISVAPKSGTISPTAQKVKADGQLVIRDGDNTTLTVPGQVPSTGAVCSFSATITVNAGQIKAKAQ